MKRKALILKQTRRQREVIKKLQAALLREVNAHEKTQRELLRVQARMDRLFKVRVELDPMDKIWMCSVKISEYAIESLRDPKLLVRDVAEHLVLNLLKNR